VQVNTPVAGIGIAAQAPPGPDEGRAAKLEAVIAEIENRATWYAEPGLRSGQWVQFEARMMGTVTEFRTTPGGRARGLALFVAVPSDDPGEPRLVLHGSPAHLLEDLGHSEVIQDLGFRGGSAGPVLSRLIYSASQTPLEAVVGRPDRLGAFLLRGITVLERNGSLVPAAAEWLAGYARITMTEVHGFVCATPLYIQRLRA
jgi:hypothetical protein